ncbi:MAG TPA: TonB-dependent receptor [Terriglobales bacterium]
MVSRSARFSLLCLVAAAVLGTMLVRRANCQVLYGSVSGEVTDASAAVLPRAQVTITNDTTGLSRTTTSDADGRYRLLDLPAGTYTLKVTATGFQAFAKTGIPVVIGQINEEDLQLKVGAVTQEVTVQGSAAVLQTQKADVHTEISSYAVQNLPLNTYRNFQAVELLAPGVFSMSGISQAYPNSVADTPERSFEVNSNGLPGHDNTTRVDGATNIFIWLPDHMLIVPPQESIQEINVQTSNYDVEKGLTAGAAVDVVTKSGTNQLHGTLYGYYTGNALDARNWFNYSGNSRYVLNNDGAAVGGPIKKDKLFFFFNWDRTSERDAEAFTDLIPPTAYRTGDFSSALGPTIPGANVCTTEGKTVPLQQGMVFDPATGNPDGTNRCVFSYNGAVNVINPSLLNKGAQNYWALLPAPNQNVALTPQTPYNYVGTKNASPITKNLYTWRLDWNRTANHTIWGKWTIQDDSFFEPFDFGDAGGNGSGTAHQFAQIGTIGNTWTISPTLVMTGHVGFDRMSEYAHPPGYGQPLGQTVLGIAGTNTPSGNILYTGLPGIMMEGFSGLGSLNSWEPDQRNDWTLTISDNLTKIRGAHELRMGVDIAHNHLNAFQPEIFCCPRGNVIQDYGGTSLNTSNLSGITFTPFLQNSAALFDLGYTSEAQNDEQFIKSTGEDWQYAVYFGDRWRVTPKLTADLGIRWEYFPLITRDGIDKGELFVPDTNTLLFGGLGGNPVHNGITSSKTLFMPRIGLAYQLNPKTVIRGGFGMSNDTTPLERPLRGFYPLAIGADNYNNSTPALAAACAGSAAGASCFAPYGDFATVGVPIIQNPDLSSGSIVPPSNVTVGTLGPGEYHRGYVEAWNFFVERQLPSGWLASAGYVGNHYVHEFNGADLVAAPLGEPQPLLAGALRTGGTYQFEGYLDSHYNSLQVTINHRASHGLFVQAAYTYSSALGYVSDNTWENGLRFNCPPSAALPQGCRFLNYGPLSFDHTHNFKAAFVYDLPFGTGQKWASTGGSSKVLGGWKLNGVFSAFSGSPLQIGQDTDTLATFDTPQVPTHVGAVQYLGASNNSSGYPQWFNPSAFVPTTAPTQIGDAGNFTSWLRGPGLWQLDASLARVFRLSERFTLEIRAEAENIANTPHFNNPSQTCTNTNGTCGGTFGELNGGSYGQRVIQFGGFLRF